MNNRTVRLGLRAMVLCAIGGAAAAQTTTRVSVSSTGTAGNGESRRPCISADGRIVVFHSTASDLVPNDSNGAYDVFAHDRVTGQTRRVSVSSAGAEGDQTSWYPSISADGRFVAFESEATNLVAADTNQRCDIFVHDLLTGQTTRASVDSEGVEANGATYHAFLSGDGRHVSFWGDASNLVSDDTNGTDDGFVHDMLTGETARVSLSTAGVEGNDRTTITKISHTGRIVIFMSRASNLVPDDANPGYDIFVRDLDLGVTERVSVNSDGEGANNECYDGSISGDGRIVSFSSLADNLAPDDTNGTWDVFVRDRVSGLTERVSVNSAGEEANNEANGGTVSSDGRFIAFESIAANLVPGDTNGCWDIFVRDRLAGTTVLVSVNSLGEQANDHSYYPAAAGISADGSFVAFDSEATNLVPSDENGLSDAFIHYLPPVLPPLPFPADAQSAAIAIANFDGDALNRPDLAVANAGANSVSLLLNNGVPGAEPSFAAPVPGLTTPVGAQPTAIATEDIDADGKPDLAVANSMGNSVSILLGRSDGTFAVAPLIDARSTPRAVALTDLDHDNLPDLLIARTNGDVLSVRRNLGGGNFGADQPQQVPPNSGPSGVGSGDLDNDKDIDVVVTVDQAGAMLVFPNAASLPGEISLGPPQTFPLGGDSPRPVSVVLKDFDSDGFLDAATSNKGDGTVAVFRNLGLDGGGVWLGFAEPLFFDVGAIPVSIGADDVYGFGAADLFTANAFVDASNESSVSLLKNISSGPGDIAFEPERRIAVPPLAAHVASGDVNLDNRVDLAVATGFDAGGLTASHGVDGSPHDQPMGVAAVLAGASPSVVLAPCDGDANGDRFVDFLDLNIVLGFYGQAGPALPGDLNTDGEVDFLDLNIVLSAFGTAC